MSQWSFVIAAYCLVIFATVALTGWAYLTMHNAEADAEAVKRRP